MRVLPVALGALVVAFTVLGACGDNHPSAGDVDAAGDIGPDTRDILERLRALPRVTVSEETPRYAPPGYRYFVLQVSQPVDHGVEDGPRFDQEVSLIHRDVAAPMVAFTTGYDDYYFDYAAEPTMLLAANQISIEHRFFGTSRPAPADWSALTIEQMAADEHAIITNLKSIYGAAWISTGGSKGGMTAVFHRRFYPDDVDGTVAYVAPLSFAVPDPRYATFLDAVGTSECRTKVRDIASEMLQHRRPALLARAQTQAADLNYSYTRIAIGPALEAAIRDLEWTFWQYAGITACDEVPAITDDDDTLWSFLDEKSGVAFNADDESARFEAYFYQAYAQLGSPGTIGNRGDTSPPHLEAWRIYGDAAYAGTLPAGEPVPVHDPAAMADIDAWVQSAGNRIVFVYGQWDPWSGGAFRLGAATDSLLLEAAGGTHGSGLLELAPTDRDAALAKLAAWTGVTPMLPTLQDAKRASERWTPSLRRRHAAR